MRNHGQDGQLNEKTMAMKWPLQAGHVFCGHARPNCTCLEATWSRQDVQAMNVTADSTCIECSRQGCDYVGCHIGMPRKCKCWVMVSELEGLLYICVLYVHRIMKHASS